MATTTDDDGHDGHFKVIIAGGGPVGLTLAHALATANIDFVVLERHTSFEAEAGATLAIWPHNVRVYDQLGLLQDLHDISMDINLKVSMDPDGTVTARERLFEIMEKNHGHPWLFFFRPKVTQTLYNRLPDKSKALAGKSVSDISLPSSGGVLVTCSDGSTVSGSIVVGADGVHSRVRQIMSSSANNPPSSSLSESVRARATLNAKPSFVTTYLCLFGHLDPLPGLEVGAVFETRGRDAHFQVVCTEHRVFFICYVTREPGPRVGDENVRFGEEETEAVVKTIANRRVTPRHLFRELWGERRWAFLTESKEGWVRDTWDRGNVDGRVVLVGDAAHKMSPELGWGFNTGVQDVVVLANELRALAVKHEVERHVLIRGMEGKEYVAGRSSPTEEELRGGLERYAEKRRRMVRFSCWVSETWAKMLGWHTRWLEMLDRRILPMLGGDKKMADWVLAPIVRSGLVLDYLPEKGRRDGRVPWKHFPREVKG